MRSFAVANSTDPHLLRAGKIDAPTRAWHARRVSEEPGSDVAAGLIASLAEGGEPVDAGHFTLDPAAALAKLRRHQLGEPGDHLLMLVEAAWLVGRACDSPSIRFSLGEDTSVEFGDIALAEVLPDLFSAALAGIDPALEGEARTHARVLQLLGLAANAALALEPRQLRVSASDAGGRTSTVLVSPNGEIDVAPLREGGRPSRIRFEMEGGSGWQRSERELARLYARCEHASLPIWVGDERISLGPLMGFAEPATSEKRAAVEVDGRTLGFVGHTAIRGAPPRLIFVNRGLSIEEPLEAEPGLQAIVEVDLPLDIARQRLVETAELERIRAAVRATLSRLAPPRPPGPPVRRESTDIGPVVLVFLVVSLVLPFLSTVNTLINSFTTKSEDPGEPPEREATTKSHQPRIVTSTVDRYYSDCLVLPHGTSCAMAAAPDLDPEIRARLLLRGCTFQHDAGACNGLIISARTHASQAPVLGFALAMSCLNRAGHDCIAAAEHIRRGDYPSAQTLAPFLMGDPVPEVEASELLARACAAGLRDACE